MPPRRRVSEPSACVNFWKTASNISGRYADTGVLNEDLRNESRFRLLVEFHTDLNVSMLGELKGVSGKAQEDLADAVGIADEHVCGR